MKKTKQRSFLKWAGGKYSLIDTLSNRLPAGKRLIEPFVGSGSVFLNIDYPSYLVSDINPDLIHLFQIVKTDCHKLIMESKRLFTSQTNTKSCYDHFKSEFNLSSDAFYRALLFIYLNRHGFNGLCRYNRSGCFNVPFGQIAKPYFPEREIEIFSERSQNVQFKLQSFTDTFTEVRPGDVIYCDPPYVPLSITSKFSSYSVEQFGYKEQLMLTKIAESASRLGNHVLISNHDTSLSKGLYAKATIYEIHVSRTISCNSKNRKPAMELIAHFEPK